MSGQIPRALVAILVLLALLAVPFPVSTPAYGAGTDWRDEAIYFVMTDRFRNGDASNDLDATTGRPSWWQGGDLRGVIERLDYVKGLGMTAIWITPVTEQTRGGFHGYWTLDFYRVDPHLGDLATLKELVRSAHAKRLKVVLDVVLNHVGYEHPWLTDGRHEGWFHPRCEMVFSVQQSVERCWLAGLPDLNTEHPAVRTYLIEWSLWLARETGVDGFRLDTARHLPSEFVREWSTALKREFQDFWILGEVFVDDYREQRPYLDAGVDAITDFFTYRNVARALGPGGDLSWLRLPPPVAESFLGERAHARATFIDNHDVPRFIGPSDPDEATRARLTQALTYLFGAPGTPVLYYGTEVGLPGGPDPDNRRLMPWVAERNALQDFVARLAALRQERPALRRGSWVRLAAEREFFAFARQDAAGDLVVVALNGSDASIEREVGLEELQLAAGLEPHSLLDSARGTARLAERTLAISLPPRGAQLLWLGPRLSIAPAADLHSVVIAAAVALVLLAIAGLGALWRRRISGRA